MSSYLPQSIDYIPQIQPFSPNLNFYQNILSQKEGQYQQGYNKISNLYGQLLNSPMLRSADIEQRDKYFKDAQTQIERISGLDLSLQENVDSAYQVFQPLINDKNIWNDMAKTKQIFAEEQRGEGFRNCKDEASCGGMFSQNSMRALNYWKEDFSKADDKTALNMQVRKFAPDINVTRQMTDYATKSGIKVTSLNSSGGYNYTTTNGEAGILPISDLFTAIGKDDPKIREMYDTQAYLQEKDEIHNYMAQNGVDEATATNAYLSTMSKLEENARARQGQLNTHIKNIQAKSSIIEDKLKQSGGEDNQLLQSLNNYNEQLKAAQGAKSLHDASIDTLNKNVTVGADTQNLLWRMRNVVSKAKMERGFFDAATAFSRTHTDIKREVDPYYKLSVEFNNDLKKMQFKSDLDIREAIAINQAKHQVQNIADPTQGLWEEDVNGKFGNKGSSASTNQSVIDTEQKSLGDHTSSLKYSAETGLEQIYSALYNSYVNDQTGSVNSNYKTSALEDLNAIFPSGIIDPKTGKLLHNTIQEGLIGKDPKTIFNNAINILKSTNSPDSPRAHIYPGILPKLGELSLRVNQEDKIINILGNNIKKNNLAIINAYQNDAIADIQSDPDLKPYIKNLANDKGEMLTADQYARKWAQTTGSSLQEGMDAYNKASSLFREVVLANPMKVNTLTGDKSYLTTDISGAAGGGSAGKTVHTSYDDGLYNLPGTGVATNVLKSFKDGASLGVVFGNPGEKIGTDPVAEKLLARMQQDIMDRTDKQDKNNLFGDIAITQIAGGDPSKVAVTMTINDSYIQHPFIKGNAKGEGGLLPKEYQGQDRVTMYFDRNKLPQELLSNLNKSPLKVINEVEDIPVTTPYDNIVGTAVIHKKDKNGNIPFTYNMIDWSSGKPVTNTISKLYPPETDIDKLQEFTLNAKLSAYKQWTDIKARK